MSDFFPVAPFSGETDGSIRDRMLLAVSDEFIKLEGDIIYDTLQPCALEIERLYQALETQMWQAFPQSATGENLDALALQHTGLERATNETDDAFRARVIAELPTPVGAGSQADYARVLDAIAGVGPYTVESPSPGDVQVYFTTPTHDEPSAPLVTAVDDALAANGIPVGVANFLVTGSTTESTADLTMVVDGPYTTAQATAWRAALRTWADELKPGWALVAGDFAAAANSASQLDYAVSFTYSGANSDVDGWGAFEPATPGGTYKVTAITVEQL